jgi:hypothetical protein
VRFVSFLFRLPSAWGHTITMLKLPAPVGYGRVMFYVQGLPQKKKAENDGVLYTGPVNA